MYKKTDPVIVLEQKSVISYRRCKEFLSRFKYISLCIKISIPSLNFIHQDKLSEKDISEKSTFVENYSRLNELLARKNSDDISLFKCSPTIIKH